MTDKTAPLALVVDNTKVAEVTHTDLTHEHGAYEPDNCPICGTSAVIPTDTPVTNKKPRAKKTAEKTAAPVENVTPTECVSGHPRAEFWTTTAAGRKYCKACARAASQRSRAKNPRPTTRKVAVGLSDAALDSIVKVANFKNTSSAIREELLAFVTANRKPAAES